MQSFVWVFLGGGLGSALRYWVSLRVPAMLGFPWATLLVNVLASGLLGCLMGAGHKEQRPELWWLLATGFCGGFSTFSTFSADTIRLLQEGQSNVAFANIGLNLACCLAATWLGFKWWSGNV